MNAQKQNTAVDGRIAKVLTKLSDALQAAGYGWDPRKEATLLRDPFTIHGIQTGFTLQEQRQSGHWAFRRGTGRLYITLGDYGDKRTYPEPKNGFDIPKTVQRIIDYVEGQKKQRAREQQRKDAFQLRAATAKKINEHLGLTGPDLRARVDYKTGNYQILLPQYGLTAEQCEALLKAAKEILGR